MAMDVNGVIGGYRSPATTTTTTNTAAKADTTAADKTTAAAAKEAAETAATPKTDTFVKTGAETADTTYSRKGLSSKQLEALQNQRIESYQSMITQMFGKQAGNASKSGGTGNSLANLMKTLTNAGHTPESAAAAIADDGEWGVDAVATRLVNMALSLSGGDSGKASLLRDAVKKGFEAAGVAWGDKLPGICNDTYDETMKRFDYWEQNGSMDGYTMGASKTADEE